MDESRSGTLIRPFAALLATLVIEPPPLRERREDIPDLALAIINHCQAQWDRSIQAIEPEALDQLVGYSWPGNIRELEMALAQSAKRAAGAVITRSCLPRRIRAPAELADLAPASAAMPPLDRIIESVERRLMTLALTRFRGNKSQAAEYLGLSRARFLRRWEQLAAESEDAAKSEQSEQME